MGIVFDTYEGGGAFLRGEYSPSCAGYRFRYPGVYGEFPLVCRVRFFVPVRVEALLRGERGRAPLDCRVSFSIPMWAVRRSCEENIVPLVLGIVFDTYVGCGHSLDCRVRFFVPTRVGALLRGERGPAPLD